MTWVDVFNDGPQCTDVDFLIMIQPKADPSTYTLSDFTRKGQRTATLKLVDPTADYIFQVLVPWPLVFDKFLTPSLKSIRSR